VMVTIGLFSSGDYVEGVSQGGCNDFIDINQISRYCGLKMVARIRISMGK
jgi:hypothetical protein